MLELINVTKIYKSKSGDTAALKKVNLTFGDTGLVFVIGKSGSGKTTLLNTIGGLDSIDGGDIVINGKRFSEFSTDDYDSYRNTFIGFIFQEYNLLPEYTAEKNVMLANELQGVPSDDEEIARIFELVDIGGLQKRKISELSGGQKQRVAIARALIKNPSIIMADEPTGALDSLMGIQIMNTLKKLSQEKLVIVVSHDMELAETYADRVIRISDGRVVEDYEVSTVAVDGNVHETETELTVKQGSKLTKEETEVIVNAIENSKPINLTNQELLVREKKPTVIDKIKTGVTKTIDLIKSKMKYKSLALLGIKSLGVKPLRLAFTIFLSAIAFAVFGLFDTIAAYNRANIVANALRVNEYSAISVNSVYHGKETSANVGVDQEYIDKMSQQLGYDFRGVYGIFSESSSSVNENTYIEEIMNSTRQDGVKYYAKYVNGYVEFKESEVFYGYNGTTKNVIAPSSYNYEIIYGNYPSYVNSDSRTRDVAISKYLAECIMHYDYLIDSTQRVTEISQLLGQKINFYGTTNSMDASSYRIVGIVDCGEIPDKYNELKKQYPHEADSILASDLNTLLFSSMHLNVFVGENFTNFYRAANNRQTGYRSNGYEYSVNYAGMSSNYIKGTTVFYNSDNFDSKSVIFFDDDRATNIETGKITLADDEVLIDASQLLNFYKSEIRAIGENLDNYGNRIQTAIGLNKAGYKMSMIQMLNKNYSQPDDIDPEDKEDVFQAKRRAMNYIINGICGLNGAEFQESKVVDTFEYKTITLRQRSENTSIQTTKTYKVVGVYYGVDVNAGATSSSSLFSNLLLNSNALEEIDVCSNQGFYARMISPVIESTTSTNALASLITSKNGMGFNWFNNGILLAIEQNEKTIKEFANLFLYVSIALAIFSIFMLFNYISTSINSKRRSIGVLRALGSNGMDIFKMFFTESAIIALINATFAVLFAFIGCFFVNLYIREAMHLSVSFALFTFRQVIIIAVSCIFTALAACVIPIINISKEKPVNLIARSN